MTNTPDLLTSDVADLAMGFVIALLRRLPTGSCAPDAGLRAGPLATRIGLGIVGLGRIGAPWRDRPRPST